ncbi:MAG: hypothetical protein HQK66_07635, partial [Desulfamplus sp.]|nr:hypothetical protein [Desulfamplus sp.]
SVLIETPGQPISAKPNISIDDKGKLWVYFGTGRYYIKTDETISTQQTFYGIVESFDDHATLGTKGYMDIYYPEDKNQNCIRDEGEAAFTSIPDKFTWKQVVNPKSLSEPSTALIDVSEAVIKSDKTISDVKYGSTEITKWTSEDPKGLIEIIDDYIALGGGWFMDFRLPTSPTKNSAKERSISQPNVFGEMVLFTTYIPSGDMCTIEGKSNLYALYYKTGTPYYEDVLFDANGEPLSIVETGDIKKMVKRIDLGDGLASTPSIHSGGPGGDDGTFIQTSIGNIINLKQVFPAKRDLGIITWKEGNTECN